MSQTIICEYLAAWESTGIAPDPTAFGFASLYAMLEECQDVMLKLGTAVNDGKNANQALYREANTSRLKIAELESQLKWQEDAHQLALRKAGAEMESLQEKNADLEAIAAEREKIATIAVKRFLSDLTNAA